MFFIAIVSLYCASYIWTDVIDEWPIIIVFYYLKFVFWITFTWSLFQTHIYVDVPRFLYIKEDNELIFYTDTKLYVWKPVFKKNTYMEYFSNNIFWKFK